MAKNNAELIELVEGCIRQESKSQEMLFRNYYGKMMGVCMRYAKNPDEAKDMVQEGFIKVFDKIGKFNFEGSFEGWMRRIIVNNSIDIIRKNKNAPLSLDENENIKIKLSNADDIEEKEAFEITSLKAEVAMEAIQELSPAYRTVFNMYVIENYTHKEIAEILNVSEGTSKSNLAKAKQNLKRILQDKFVNV